MNCSYCNARAVFHATHFGKFLCRSHLEGYLLRKLRRNLHHHRLVSPGDTIAIRDDGSPVGAAVKELFKKAVRNWPVKVVREGEPHNKLLVPDTLECETSRILEGLANGELWHGSYTELGVIKPFRDFSSKELFVLGWLNGCRKEGHKEWKLHGTAGELNLLRSWDRIMEAHRLNTASRGGRRKQGREGKSQP